MSQPFVISFWSGPPNSEISIARYKEMKDAGFTTVAASTNEHYDTKAVKAMLDTASDPQIGLSVIVTDERITGYSPCLGTPAESGYLPDWAQIEDRVSEVVADWSGSPALIGYFVADEPGEDAFPNLARIVNQIRLRDPDRIAFINLLPTYGFSDYNHYVEYVANYINTVRPARPNVLCFDNYGGKDDFTTNCRIIRDAATQAGVDFWVIINACVPETKSPVTGTSVEDMRWTAMEALRYGARGILYFVYWMAYCTPLDKHAGLIDAVTGRPTQRYSEVTQLNRDIRAITEQTGEVLFGRVRATSDCPGGAGDLWLLDSSLPSSPAGERFGRRLTLAGWDWMRLTMPGYELVNALSDDVNGFWLSARNNLLSRTFYVVNVVAGIGRLYRVTRAKVEDLGLAGWADPYKKNMLGMSFEDNGFWVSIE